MKFIALCDIFQTFKSRPQIMSLRHSGLCGLFRLSLWCCHTLLSIGEVAQPIIFGDTMVIGMPTKKNHSRARRGKFCEQTLERVFLLAGFNIPPGSRDAGYKIARECFESARNNSIRMQMFDLHARGSHLRARESHCACVNYVSILMPLFPLETGGNREVPPHCFPIGIYFFSLHLCNVK